MDCPSCDNEVVPDAFFCQWCDRFIPAPEKGKKGNLFRRFMALSIDPLIAVLLYVVALGVFGAISEDLGVVMAFVFPVLYFVWFLVLLRQGLTPGKKLLGLQVVDHQTGELPGYGKMFLREIVGRLLSGLVLGLGYLWALFDKNAQAWHDRLAGTVVLRRSVPAPPAGRPETEM